MSTGDVQASVERLKGELRHIRYPADLDSTGAKLGMPAALLPILNYVLLKFSRHVAHQLASAGYELQGKSDARFVEAAFKIFRDKFGLRPVLTTAQFLEQGFAERKLGLISDVIAYCKSFHNAAVRRARLAAATVPSKSGSAVVTKSGPSQASKASRKSKSKSAMGKPVAKVQRHSAEAHDSTAAAVHARLSPSAAQLATAQDMVHCASPSQPCTESLGGYGAPVSAQSRQPVAANASSAVFTQQHERSRQLSSFSQPASVANISPIKQHQQQQLHTDSLQQHRHAVSGTEAASTSGWGDGWVVGGGAAELSHHQQPHHAQSMTHRQRTQHASARQPSHVPHAAQPCASSFFADLLPSQQFWLQAAAISATDQSGSHTGEPAPSARPTAAWFTNPAYTNAPSPMPSPDKQPRSHPPPLPHPSQPAGPQQHAGPSHSHSAYPSLPPSRPGTAQAGHATSSYSNHSWLVAHARQATSHSHHAAQAALPSTARQQQPTMHSRMPADGQQEGVGGAQASLPTFRPGHSFPSLPARFTAGPQSSQSAEAGSSSSQQQHAHHQAGSNQVHEAPQHAQHDLESAAVQQPRSQQHQWPHQMHLQQQELQLQQQESQTQQQQQWQLQSNDSGSKEQSNVLQLVQQLQQQVLAAQREAAVARAEADDRVETLEARVTLLEGRAKFLEGELTAVRQTASQTEAPSAMPNVTAQDSRRLPAGLTTCLSPSSTVKQQARPVRQHLLPSQPFSMEPEQRQDELSSPTKSTAKTPARKTGRIGTAVEQELSVMTLQSPGQRACLTPASPASSLHSYTSTKELIENIQNRYLEAQSFLKSYKL